MAEAVVGRFSVVELGSGDEAVVRAAAASAAGKALGEADGVLTAKGWMGFPFSESPGPEGPDIRLAAVTALGPSAGALEAAWSTCGVDAALDGDGVVARLDVEGEVLRYQGLGWGPMPVGIPRGGGDDDPVLVIITGDLLPQHLEAFTAAGGAAVAQANRDPGYLGGCGLTSTGFDITSFSFWRSAKAARKYAFGAGAHREAKEADQAGGWHDDDTSVFAAFRVTSATGTLLGRTIG